MKPFDFTWPGRRFLVVALCLAVMGIPAGAMAQDDDDSSEDPVKVQKEIRVYKLGGEDGEDVVVIAPDGEDADLPGGYLGVRVQDVTRDLAKAKELPTDEGALVNRVDPDSPADDAGIQRGDVIVEVNKNSIEESSDLIRIVRGLAPGTKVPVVVIRDGNRKTFQATLDKRPFRAMRVPPPGARWHQNWDGSMPNPEAFSNMRMQRRQIQKQLAEIQEQLEQLRETDLAQIEEQLKALREELQGLRTAPKSTKKATPKAD